MRYDQFHTPHSETFVRSIASVLEDDQDLGVKGK